MCVHLFFISSIKNGFSNFIIQERNFTLHKRKYCLSYSYTVRKQYNKMYPDKPTCKCSMLVSLHVVVIVHVHVCIMYNIITTQ